MATFIENLWGSVFTPGATPALIVATNATFAALQLLLIGLLVATYSIHFVVLSVLCGGLWWSINWFATELRAAQAKEDEAEKLRRRKKGESDWRSKGEVDDSADDEGEDTEVEKGRSELKGSTSSLNPAAGSVADDDSRIREEIRDAMGAAQSSGLASSSHQATAGAEVRQRVVEDLDRSGEISTDSEWEKVSNDGNR